MKLPRALNVNLRRVTFALEKRWGWVAVVVYKAALLSADEPVRTGREEMPHPTVPASRRCETTAQPFSEPMKGNEATPGKAIGSLVLPRSCQEGTCLGIWYADKSRFELQPSRFLAG